LIPGVRLRQALTCSEQGFFRDEKDCTKFYRCVGESDDGADLKRYEFECPPGTIFDDRISSCNHLSQVENPPADCNVELYPVTPEAENGQSSVVNPPEPPAAAIPVNALFYYPNPQQQLRLFPNFHFVANTV